MKLPFFGEKTSNKLSHDYIFALEINPSYVKSSIWIIANTKVQVLSIGNPSAWNAASQDKFITACDESLSDATRKLDSTGKIQPEKVLLGLPADWISEDKIRPEHLKLLKGLTRELSLAAVGYVTTPEAVIRHIYSREGVPPTAILTEVNTDAVNVSLVRMGKISTLESVRRSGHLGQDLAEGLSRLKGENMLPSRMLIYGTNQNLETARQEILSFAWQAPQYKLPFLHFPKVEILPENFSIEAISQAGGSEVTQTTGMISAPSSPEDDSQPASDFGPASNPEDLGFFSDVDIAQTQLDEPIQEQPPAPVSTSPKKHPSFTIPHYGFHLPKLPKTIYLYLPLALLVLGAIFWFFWFKLSADITVAYTPETRDYDLELTADPGISISDPAAGLLPAAQVSEMVSAEKSKQSTGSKIIGDKAVGDITLINGTSVPRIFPAGTVITSPSGLKFTLNISVEAASASGTADPNSYQPGKVTAKVTAATIGSDSNLSAGTQFRIGSFSSLDYVARNDAAFTGGSSRQVQAVSKQDIIDLRTELLNSLTEEAKSKLTSSEDTSRLVIPESVVVKVDSETVNHQPDEVFDSVSMKLGVKATGLSITKSDLEQIVSDRISTEIPADLYQYQPIDYEFGIKSSEGNKAKVAVSATTHLLPKVDYEQVKQQLTGKSFTVAEKYLKSLRGVSGVSISLKPKIFSWFGLLPHVKQNIRFINSPS